METGLLIPRATDILAHSLGMHGNLVRRMAKSYSVQRKGRITIKWAYPSRWACAPTIVLAGESADLVRSITSGVHVVAIFALSVGLAGCTEANSTESPTTLPTVSSDIAELSEAEAASIEAALVSNDPLAFGRVTGITDEELLAEIASRALPPDSTLQIDRSSFAFTSGIEATVAALVEGPDPARFTLYLRWDAASITWLVVGTSEPSR